MTVTLNLSDQEARQIDHLIENEIQSLVTDEYQHDDEYIQELKHIRSKL